MMIMSYTYEELESKDDYQLTMILREAYSNVGYYYYKIQQSEWGSEESETYGQFYEESQDTLYKIIKIRPSVLFDFMCKESINECL